MKTLGFVLGVMACGGSVAVDAPVVPGRPPAPPVDGAPASTEMQTFAIDALLLGDEGWKSYGYDLDHTKTTRDSTNVCALASGAPKVNQLDGVDGVDNAWGSTIVPLLQLIAVPALSANAASALAKTAPLDLAVTGLQADPSSSAVGLVLVTSFSEPPTRFEASYVSHGTFVSGAGDGPLMLAIPFLVNENDAPVVLPLAIHAAIVTFAAGGEGEIAGTIAGVLDVGEVTAAALSFAQEVDATDFVGHQKALDWLASQLAQAADIGVDETNAPGAPCSAVSIGVRFTARRLH